jgi:hypothetical protein
MQKNLRWSAIPTAMLLLLAACSSTGGSPSASASSAASGGGGASGDPTAVCAADKFGCVKYGPNDKINLGTALSISGANASLGLDSQYGVQVAVNLRGKVAGHDVKLTNTDAGCSADGGTTAAQQLKADPTIVAVVGTSCSSAGVPASQILDLIKHVEIGKDGAPTEIKMVLTTPFCPWAGDLIQTVKQRAEEVVGPPVKVTLLADRWEPPPGLF